MTAGKVDVAWLREHMAKFRRCGLYECEILLDDLTALLDAYEERERCRRECTTLHRLLEERNLALYCHESELQTENDRYRLVLEHLLAVDGYRVCLGEVVAEARAALGKDGSE